MMVSKITHWVNILLYERKFVEIIVCDYWNNYVLFCVDTPYYRQRYPESIISNSRYKINANRIAMKKIF